MARGKPKLIKDKGMSQTSNRNPILIALAGLVGLCLICLCVLLILLVLPRIDFDISDLFAGRPDETQAPQDAPAASLPPGETASDDPEASVEPAQDESYARALEMAGEWQGMWINNTFSSSGAASLIIEVAPSGVATLTLDLDGFIFGMLDPDPITYTAQFGGGRIDLDVSDDPVFGDFLASGLDDGSVSIEAELIPVEDIARLTAEGTFAPEGIHLNYTVEFFGGAEATGEVHLTRVP